MTRFVHPATEDITLTGVLAALADPVRLQILQAMLAEAGCLSCVKAMPCNSIAKSTLSHHFRILRESGLIHTTKKGVEHLNTMRYDDVESRFPGLLNKVITLFIAS